MRWFQLLSAFILVIAVAGVIWINRSPLPDVELIYIQEIGFPRENKAYIHELTQYVETHKRLSLRIVNADPASLSSSILAVQGPQKVLLGCFTGTCKMQVLDVVDDTVIPFLFLGRSHGLVQAPNLWHLGPMFSQTLSLILPIIKGRESESVHLLGKQDIDSHMNHYILQQYLRALDFQWGRALLMTSNNEDVISDIIESTSTDLYINTACGEAGLKIYQWIDDSLQRGIHTCIDPIDEASQSEHWFITFSPDTRKLQLLTSWAFSKAILDSQIERTRWSFSRLAGKQFSNNDVVRSMHIQNQHMWHNQYLFVQDGETLTLAKQVDRVEPVVFPELRQATDWDLQMQLYWRNKNGRWQSL